MAGKIAFKIGPLIKVVMHDVMITINHHVFQEVKLYKNAREREK